MDLRSGFALGSWTVLPLENRLRKDGETVRVQPKSMDVLVLLAQANGSVVERKTIMQEIWDGRAVTDEPLTRCIGELRRAFGDDPSDPGFIETIPRRGYRLLVEAMPNSDESAVPAEAPAAPEKTPERSVSRVRQAVVALSLIVLAVILEVTIERSIDDADEITPAPIPSDIAERSIAVLPFEDMSAEKDQEYMGDGIAEELLNLLAAVPDLRVISRSSSFSLKGTRIDMREIARRFEVAYVLEGSVRTSGDTIRITAQLIDGRTDTHVWSDTYERTLDDVFAIQDEIAEAVFRELRVTLLEEAPRSRATDPEAYALFLQARSLHENAAGQSMVDAVGLYRAAVDIDPEYVPAWVWLAAAYDDTVNSLGLPREEVISLAQDAIETALTIDPDDALALGMHAILIEAWERDLSRAAAQMQRAIDIDPANPILLRWLAILLTELGRHDDAVRVGEYLFARDPVGRITRINLAEMYLNAGRFDDALQICRIEVALSTDDSPCGSRLILALVYTGDATSALEHLERVRPSRVYTRLAPLVYSAAEADAEYGQALAELQAALEAGDTGLGYWLVNAYAFAGDSEAMYFWAERLAAAGALSMTPDTAFFAEYRDDERWQRLLAAIGQNPQTLEAIPLTVPALF